MAGTDFNMAGTAKAERKLMATFVNVGTTLEKSWEIVGAGIEDSSIEFGADVSSVTDILGNTETSVNKFEEKQSLDPNELRGGQLLNSKLLDIARRRAYSEFSQFEVMRAWKILGTSTAITAELDTGCTITPQSVGGASYIGMPIEISFSGNRTFGTIDSFTDPTFTADANT